MNTKYPWIVSDDMWMKFPQHIKHVYNATRFPLYRPVICEKEGIVSRTIAEIVPSVMEYPGVTYMEKYFPELDSCTSVSYYDISIRSLLNQYNDSALIITAEQFEYLYNRIECLYSYEFCKSLCITDAFARLCIVDDSNMIRMDSPDTQIGIFGYVGYYQLEDYIKQKLSGENNLEDHRKC